MYRPSRIRPAPCPEASRILAAPLQHLLQRQVAVEGWQHRRLAVAQKILRAFQRLVAEQVVLRSVVVDVDQARRSIEAAGVQNLSPRGNRHGSRTACLHNPSVFIGQRSIPDDPILQNELCVHNRVHLCSFPGSRPIRLP